MVENVVAKEYLSESMIEAGAQILTKLDAEGVPISSAFWFYEFETNDWRLYLAIPNTHQTSVRPWYMRINAATKELGERISAVPWDAPKVIDADDPLIGLLRRVVTPQAGMKPVRLTRIAVGGRLIDDVLIYRI